MAMNVLHNERKGTFGKIGLAWLPDGARWGVRQECLIVSAAVIVTGEPESARRPENQQRGRKQEPPRPPRWTRPEPAVRGIPKKFRRIKRRDIIAGEIIVPLKSSPGGINDKSC